MNSQNDDDKDDNGGRRTSEFRFTVILRWWSWKIPMKDCFSDDDKNCQCIWFKQWTNENKLEEWCWRRKLKNRNDDDEVKAAADNDWITFHRYFRLTKEWKKGWTMILAKESEQPERLRWGCRRRRTKSGRLKLPMYDSSVKRMKKSGWCATVLFVC